MATSSAGDGTDDDENEWRDAEERATGSHERAEDDEEPFETVPTISAAAQAEAMERVEAGVGPHVTMRTIGTPAE